MDVKQDSGALRKLMTPKAVAEFLIVPDRMVYEVIKKLPARAKLKVGNRLRVWQDELLSWCQSQEGK